MSEEVIHTRHTIDTRRWWAIGGVVCTSILFAYAISLPLIQLPRYQVHSYHLWASTPSFISMVQALWADGQQFLAAVIVLFAGVLPVVKLYHLWLLAAMPRRAVVAHKTALHRLGILASCSMLDVFALAVCIFVIKQRGSYTSEVLPGLLCLGACVVLVHIVERLVREPRVRTHPSAFVWWCAYATLLVCIVAGTYTLALGITESIVHISVKYVSWLGVGVREYSMLSLTWALWEKASYFLFGVILLFSLVFPLSKLIVLLGVFSYWRLLAGRTRIVHTLEWLGRYSMTDVMVLALLVFYTNGSGYTESVVLPGTYYFTASVALTMLGFMCASIVLHTNSPAKSSHQPKQKEGK